MADSRWTMADAKRYLAETGRKPAPGSMALDAAPAKTTQLLASDDDPEVITSLLQEIRRLAKQHGWRGEESYQAIGPDCGVQCILVREKNPWVSGRVIFAYLTSNARSLLPKQKEWHDSLTKSLDGIEAYHWKPSDLERIGSILARKVVS